MLMLAIWETPKDVIEKPVRSKSELKNAKFAGKKPDKLIVTDDTARKIGNKVLRASVAYDGIIISTSGKKIYDGKNKSVY